MKKVWKWVIGIVIVLVIVAVVVGGAFLLRNRLGNMASVTRFNRPGVQVPGTDNIQPGAPGPFPGLRRYGDNGFRGPGMYMRGRGMMGFGGFNILGGIVRGLFSLGLLALVVLGVVWLVTYLRRPMVPVAAAAPVVSAATAGAVAPLASLVATHPCPKCSQPVQEDWQHCPHCGESL